MGDNEGQSEPETYDFEDSGIPSQGELEDFEEESQESLFSRLGESSDDPEQKRRYFEYCELIKEIECQNTTIENLKQQILILKNKEDKKPADEKTLKNLCACMETENTKLKTMLNQAMHLQNFGSRRRWRDLPIVTTFDEDNFKPACNVMPPPGTTVHAPCSPCQPPCPPCKKPRPCGSSELGRSCSGADLRDDKMLRCLCQAMTKLKITCPEDKRLISEICSAINGGSCSSETDKSQSCSEIKGKPNAQYIRSLASQVSKIKVRCPSDRKVMQEIAAVLYEGARKEQQRDQSPCVSISPKPRPCLQQKSRRSSLSQIQNTDSLQKLKTKIFTMQSSVNRLKQEIAQREKMRDCMQLRSKSDHASVCPTSQRNPQVFQMHGQKPCPPEPVDPISTCPGTRNTKAAELEKLKCNYTHLLTEFSKKDSQLKELEKRLRAYCGGGCGQNGGMSKADESELVIMRSRVAELKEEQVEFKCIMKEQSQQLDDYRKKYLDAQQKVEEQSVTLEKLNMSNKRIEKQINNEVKEIRNKFQEKLNELAHFPKLLENEQLKLSKACKEKEDLQNKLVLVCKELKLLKAQSEGGEKTDCRPQLVRCQNELKVAKDKISELERQRDMYCEQLKTTQEDLDTLRCESAKIIARTKERTELIKQQQQEHIDKLEKDLAQCRATACLSVSDREAVIREMQGQLNTLSYSFDAAQKQIKTLRNHIAYVSNENCFPIKC